MFRISAFVSELLRPTPLPPRRSPSGPVVIWNLIRRCNLHCRHCYSASVDKDFAGELSIAEVCTVMDDLHACGVRALILSGGEPLLRPDIFDIARRAKAMGFYVGLSSNGTLIDRRNIESIAGCGFDYVGISLDGLGATHDGFRGQAGAFQASLEGIGLCRERGLKVGIRYTMTQGNAGDLPGLLALLDSEGVDRFYFSHLNYAGRGGRNRGEDSHHRMTRQAMERIFETCLEHAVAGRPKEFTSGNNDADGVFFLHWVRRRFPEHATHIEARLRLWGGNASGMNVANIDNRGNVHADTMWWHYTLGNVRLRAFSEIWSDPDEPLLKLLRLRPRPVKGRCASCAYLDICNGNTRIRAQKQSGDLWAEDPGCYLTEDETGDPMDFPPTPTNADDALLQRALKLFDDYNRRDPNLADWNGAPHPREWLHAQFLHGWVTKLAPQAGIALRLAARCQHIGRWEVPRDACPAGRAGYLQWRNTLKEHHAGIAQRLLADAGHDAETIQAVLKIVRKQGIKRDPDVQSMENALCLVFLEHQYEEFCDRYPDKVVAVLQKTWNKMDDMGRQAAATLPLSERGQGYLNTALAGAASSGVNP